MEKEPEQEDALLKPGNVYVRTNGVNMADAGPFARREP